jgi:glucose-6-phosphate isomerase
VKTSGAFDATVERRLSDLAEARVISRIWERDPLVWSPDPKAPEIRDRLGWLTVGDAMAAQVRDLAAFADEVRPDFKRVVLCGMGGSSLAPEVLRRTFGAAAGYPSLTVLDSTDPRAVTAAVPDSEMPRTLFLISSKSGTTLEPDCLLRHFWRATGGRGAQFVAITDPETPLAALASERGFRRCFLNPPDIGGRYSVLSYFGLVPAALLGIDIARLLARAYGMAQACAAGVPVTENPAARLGAALGGAALDGRDKATFVLSPDVASFGLWAEQLIAESTGKEGKGIVPVVDEPLGTPPVYGRDRIFVFITIAGDEDPASSGTRLTALAGAGHPIVRITLADRYDLGGAFFQWEFAIAVACHLLGINAFDQPNVAESKNNTNAVLERKTAPSPAASAADLERFFSRIKPGNYLALMAYLPPTPELDRRLAEIRARLRDRLGVATTVGYGPRFLHSTGQLHKGGPPVGHFLQITERPPRDVAIPEKPFTFGDLEAAQAEGDLLALRRRGRPALRLEGLEVLATASGA